MLKHEVAGELRYRQQRRLGLPLHRRFIRHLHSESESDTEGIGSISGEPYHLAALFEVGGVHVSLHRNPIIKPRNFYLTWDAIEEIRLDEHELVLTIYSSTEVEIKLPRQFGRDFPKHLKVRLNHR